MTSGSSGSDKDRRRRRDALVSTVAIALTVIVCGAGGAAAVGLLIDTGVSASAPTTEATPLEVAVPEVPEVPSAVPTPEPSAPEPVEPTPPPPVVVVSPAATGCATAVTMSVWAHYDDDLIFMNPALGDAIAAGDCVRSVFLTGSDAGLGQGYAQGRELGILRAYNTMRGHQGMWQEKPVTLLSGVHVSQWSPEGDPDITVSFLRLPDGNLSGGGFPATGNVSLPQLLSGAIAALSPTTGAPPVSRESLIAGVGELIGAYRADRLFTHVPAESAEWAHGDHPDHAATGSVTRTALRDVGYPSSSVNYVLGYPSANLGPNVGGDALVRKLAAFRIYAAEDRVVACATDAACLATPNFGLWLQRHYVKSEAELFPLG